MWKRSRNVERLPGLFGDDRQVWLPHIAADEREGRGPLGAEPAEEAEQGLGAPVLPDPQQALARRVDLIDEREEVAAARPVDLVDADRANPGEIHVIPAPGDGHGDRAEDLIPTGAEDPRDFGPAEALGPPREEPHVRRGQLVLAIGPGDPFEGDTTARALDAPHHVEEEDAQAPQGDELEPPRREPVVGGAAPSAACTLRPVARMRMQIHGQRQRRPEVVEADVPVHTSALLLNPIQDSRDLHPAVRLREWSASSTTILFESTRDASLAAPCVWKLPDLWTQRTRPQVFAKPQTVSHSSHTPHCHIPFRRTTNTRTPQNNWSPTHRFCGRGGFPSRLPIRLERGSRVRDCSREFGLLVCAIQSRTPQLTIPQNAQKTGWALARPNVSSARARPRGASLLLHRLCRAPSRVRALHVRGGFFGQRL
jgi:hypothetical protein